VRASEVLTAYELSRKTRAGNGQRAFRLLSRNMLQSLPDSTAVSRPAYTLAASNLIVRVVIRLAYSLQRAVLLQGRAWNRQ